VDEAGGGIRATLSGDPCFHQRGLLRASGPERVSWNGANPSFPLRLYRMRSFFALLVLLSSFALAGCSHRQAVAYAPPPPEYPAIAQRAYQDGFRAARQDINDGKAPDLARHPRFRNPRVAPPAVEDYRHGFREGYEQAFRSGPAAPQPVGF
jgi:hypothetical protein